MKSDYTNPESKRAYKNTKCVHKIVLDKCLQNSLLEQYLQKFAELSKQQQEKVSKLIDETQQSLNKLHPMDMAKQINLETVGLNKNSDDESGGSTEKVNPTEEIVTKIKDL